MRKDFLGRDAGDLEHLIDEVYATDSNYKLAGQEFWCPVAYIEQSLLDLMGKSLKKPVGELLCGILRKEIRFISPPFRRRIRLFSGKASGDIPG